LQRAKNYNLSVHKQNNLFLLMLLDSKNHTFLK
jgi:hypothetical protein